MNKPHNDNRGCFRLAIGAVILATALAIWLVPEKESNGPEAIPAPSAVSSAENASRQDSPFSAVSTTSDEPEGTAAREWLARAGQPTAAQVLVQARRFQSQGRLADAWLLYFKAARQGSAEAAMALAEQADPAYRNPKTSALSSADFVQALKWYKLAARLGSKTAPERLKKLMALLQKEAAAGDEKAMLLLQGERGNK